MESKVNVTVSEDRKSAQIQVGLYGLCRVISIDLTDANSIVGGLADATNVGHQLLQGQLAQLAKRVEMLEKELNDKKANAA